MHGKKMENTEEKERKKLINWDCMESYIGTLWRYCKFDSRPLQ